MASNFLYLKVKNNHFFQNSPNPEQNSIVVYTTKQDGKIILVAKDDNGQYQKLNSTDDIQNDINQLQGKFDQQQQTNATVNQTLEAQEQINISVSQTLEAQQQTNATVSQTLENQEQINTSVSQTLENQEQINSNFQGSIQNNSQRIQLIQSNLSNYYTKIQVDGIIGDIQNALNYILDYENSDNSKSSSSYNYESSDSSFQNQTNSII